MARPTDRDRVKNKQAEIDAANKVYDKWVETYNPDLLERYFYGLQWSNDTQDWDKKKYVINLFYPSLKIKQPSLLYFRPKFRVNLQQGRADTKSDNAQARAQLQEDTLNTLIRLPDLAFNVETALAVMDAQFRFGVAEVGFTADFIDNPNAGKPILNDDNTPMQTGDGSEVTQPSKIPQKESLFIKWIPGNTFRVSANAHNRIERCDWVAYYEWHYIADLKANRAYKNTEKLKATGQLRGDSTKSEATDPDVDAHKGMVKVWKRWNLRKESDGSRMRYVWVEGAEKFLLEKSYDIFPFAALKFDERLDEWYPLPPTFNWISPQNELNETREQQRIHRKRFNRIYQEMSGTFANDEERAKFVEGEDGTIVQVTRIDGIAAIQDAPLDAAVVRNIPLTKEDFREESGISSEDRGIADAETATQANIIEMQGRVRESFGRIQVAQWLSAIGRIMLKIMHGMSLPIWVKTNVDLSSPTAMQEAAQVAAIWREIKTEDIGDMDYEVTVDVESLSPVAEASERDSWLQLLTLITNPALQIPLAASEGLLRKTVGYYGIHDENTIGDIQQGISASLMVAVQQAMAAAASKGKGTAGQAAPGPTPTNGDIQSQLMNQLPQPVM